MNLTTRHALVDSANQNMGISKVSYNFANSAVNILIAYVCGVL